MGFVMGAMIPLGAGGRKIATDIAKSFSSNDSEIQKLSKEISLLENQLSNPEISETTRTILSKQIEAKNTSIDAVLQKTVKDIEVMNDEQIKEIIDLETQRDGIEKRSTGNNFRYFIVFRG